MEFGKNFGQPIQSRLSKEFSFLTESELDAYNMLCKNALTDRHDFVYKSLQNCDVLDSSIKGKQLKKAHKSLLKEKYPFINHRVCRSLYQQALYFADKDGYYRYLK
jgi:hypothetical protein